MNEENTHHKAEEPLSTYTPPLKPSDIWAMFQETDRRFKETDKKMRELQNLFTSQWGRLIESLVEGDLVKLLNQRGIAVRETIERLSGRYEQDNYELDIVAVDGDVAVVVEVKTTLRPDDVKDFTAKLRMVKTWSSLFKDKTIYGAVAYLTAHAGSDTMAEKEGLFVIKATGSSASLRNAAEFRPKAFG